MPGPRFKCKLVDAGFFETAPMRLQAQFEIRKPSGDVWEELTADNPLAWCRILKDVTWTSPRPFGVGTTRIARALGGANVLEESFFCWEEGRRHSFYVERSSSPMFLRFAEDYLVKPTGESSCRFTWTIAAEPRSVARLLTPVNRRLLGTLFRDTRSHYGLQP